MLLCFAMALGRVGPLAPVLMLSQKELAEGDSIPIA